MISHGWRAKRAGLILAQSSIFDKSVRPGIVIIGLFAAQVSSVAGAQNLNFADRNFVADTIASGDGMISIAFAPSGHMLVCEKRGRVMVLAPSGDGFGAPAVLVDLRSQVDSELEGGLLGMALDPAFVTSRHIYLFHTTTTDQRVVRLTASSDLTSVTGAAEVVLAGFPRRVPHHKGGDLAFHPLDPDHLLVSLGDDGHPSEAQDLDLYSGKILRIRKQDGVGVADNPHHAGDVRSVRSRVWASGLRNPFRFVPSSTERDVIYVSDNGDDTDRLSRVQRGSNGGWGTSQSFVRPTDTRHQVLAAQPPAVLGIALATSGPFAEGGETLYLGNWLVPDHTGSVKRWRLNAGANPTVTALDGDGFFVTGMPGTHLVFGPDGALYGTNAQNHESLGGWFSITRIRRTGARPPRASFTTDPDPATGPAPLTVRFLDRSTDSDGTVQGWQWDFGDGATSTESSPVHVYAAAASYPVRLVVTDDAGLQSDFTSLVVVTAGGGPPADASVPGAPDAAVGSADASASGSPDAAAPATTDAATDPGRRGREPASGCGCGVTSPAALGAAGLWLLLLFAVTRRTSR